MQIQIDGTDITDLIAFSSIDWQRNDVDGPNAGRNLEGSMIRDRVATKVRLDISCHPLMAEEHTMLMNLLLPEFVTVTYDDPMFGMVSKVMYSNNHKSKYLMKKENVEYWSDISFPLIEK